jgi:membrane protein
MTLTPEQEALTADQAASVKRQRRFSVTRQFRAVRRMHPRKLAALLMKTYADWSADNATRLGAALAYYTLFSIAPVLIVVIGIAGFFIGKAAAEAQLSPWLQRFLSPEGARAAELMLRQHVSPGGGIITSVLGLVTLFLATSAFVNELRASLNLVWRVHPPPSSATGIVGVLRSTVTDRLYSFLIAVGAAVLILLSLGVNTAIGIAGSYVHGALPLPAPALHAINFLVTFLVMTAVFTLVYKTLPDAYVAWGDAWVGAVVTALMFDVGSFVLSTFLTKSGASPYGTAASVLALLAWVYYSAQVFFFGAELTRIFATTHGGGIVPVHRSFSRRLWRRPGGLAAPVNLSDPGAEATAEPPQEPE